jgi:hypothetical protein
MLNQETDFGITVETIFNLEPFLRAAIDRRIMELDPETKKISLSQLKNYFVKTTRTDEYLAKTAKVNTSYSYTRFSYDWIDKHRKAIQNFVNNNPVQITHHFIVLNSPLLSIDESEKKDFSFVRDKLYSLANEESYDEVKIKKIANLDNIKFKKSDNDIKFISQTVFGDYLVDSFYSITFRNAYGSVMDRISSFIGVNNVRLCAGMRISYRTSDDWINPNKCDSWVSWPSDTNDWTLIFLLALYPDQYEQKFHPKTEQDNYEYDMVITIPSDSGSIVDTAFHSLIPSAEKLNLTNIMKFLYFIGDGEEFKTVRNRSSSRSDEETISYTPKIKNRSDNNVEIKLVTSKWQRWESQLIWNVEAYIKCLNDAKEDLEKIAKLFKKFRTLRARVKDAPKPELFEYFREYIKKQIIADPECIQGKEDVPENIKNITKLILGNAAESEIDFDDFDDIEDSDAEEEDKAESM